MSSLTYLSLSILTTSRSILYLSSPSFSVFFLSSLLFSSLSLSLSFLFLSRFCFQSYPKNVYFFCASLPRPWLECDPRPGYCVGWRARSSGCFAEEYAFWKPIQHAARWAQPLPLWVSVDNRRGKCGSQILASTRTRQPCQKSDCVEACNRNWLPQWDKHCDVVFCIQPDGFINGNFSCQRSLPKGRVTKIQGPLIGWTSPT